MIKNLKEHFFYYLFLIGIIVLGIFLVLQTSYDKNLQATVFSIVIFLYVLWGLFHHYVNHDLNVKIVIEYILIGSFGMALFLFLIKLSI